MKGLGRGFRAGWRRRYGCDFRPDLERVEGRALTSAVHHATADAVHPHAAAHAGPIASTQADHARQGAANPSPTPLMIGSDVLARYRVFIGTITRGPARGLTLQGPLVLGYSGRIQVSGVLFDQSGARDTVVGTVFGGATALRIIVPGPHHTTQALETSGTGQLVNLRGGIPGGMTLVGSGNLNGPDLKRDFGTWETLRASRVS